MILFWFIFIPLLAGILAWIFGKYQLPLISRLICLAAMVIELIMGICLWMQTSEQINLGTLNLQSQGGWIQQMSWSWIPYWGINFSLAIDGLSLAMVLLTAFLGIVSVLASWSEIEDDVGFFHFNLMWILSGVMGVFLSTDLFLFYFFWELMLIPMYLLIIIWGHENRSYAANKFFIFTQAGGVLMLLSLLGLTFLHYKQTGVYTFNYQELLHTQVPQEIAPYLMLGLFIGFSVKLPMFPFHTWLPDAHTEAPTAGSVILAGVLLKTGAYGILRYVLPIFPETCHQMAPYLMGLGVIGSLYGAILAFSQKDLKRLIAYSSVSHMGLVLLGIFSSSPLSLQGVVMEMICHGLSTGGLFLMAGTIQEYTHTRSLDRLGGLFSIVPRLSVVAIFFAMASLGLPGLGNFIGEFLILFGSFNGNPPLTIIASIGLVFGAVYSLWILQKVFYGELNETWKISDLCPRRLLTFGSMMLALIWLGLYPRPIINLVTPSLDNLHKMISTGQTMTASRD